MEKNRFDLFLEELSKSQSVVKKIKLDYLLVDIKKKTWFLFFLLDDFVGFEVLTLFIRELRKQFKVNGLLEIDYQFKYLKDIILTNEAAHFCFDYALKQLSAEKSSYQVLKNYQITFNNNEYTIIVDSDSQNISEYFPRIITFYKKFGVNIQMNMSVSLDLKPVSEILKDKTNIVNQNAIKIVSEEQKLKVPVVNVKPIKFSAEKVKKASAISEIPIDQYQMDKYESECGPTKFIIVGKVVSIEVRQLTRSSLLKIVIADEKDAILCKRFINQGEDSKFSSIKEGMFLEIDGIAKYDEYERDVVITIKDLKILETKDNFEERQDLFSTKRVEFHVHTKMSNMDAVTDAKDYIDMISKWGHKAIAFTDHNGVYAFPEIHKAASKAGIKAIYGVEVDFINDLDIKATLNLENNETAINDANYVVFDLETTGLSVNRDKIIEIGAVKIERGEITGRFQRFVNIGEPLSEFTTSLTGITDNDLKTGQALEQVLKEFLDFSKDAIFVAHNALFDIGHLTENLKKLNIKHQPFAVVDTLTIGRVFYSGVLKRFNLKALSKYFKVELLEHHRADNDALATAKIWIMMIEDLLKRDIKKLFEINKFLINEEPWRYVIPYHLNIIVQNQVGYQNLFRLISDALTINFHNGARTLKSNLLKYREGLLIGSGCYKGDVFEKAFNRSDEELKEAILFYDYIEVQPPSNYEHLASSLGQNGKSIIEETLKKIINYSKEKKKIVIATSDAHYLNKDDKIYRDIYIRTPQVGGGIHDLKNAKVIPNQYLLTTSEMLKEFSFLGEELSTEIVITNTNLLNDSISEIVAFKKELYSLADDAFIDNLGVKSIKEELEKLVYENAFKIYGNPLKEVISSRIELELKSIINNDFAPIYYMAYLLVKKSLSDGYLVGSRGSIGSSLVATLLDITEVNPLKPHYRCPNADFVCFKLTDDAVQKGLSSKDELDFQKNFEGIKSGYDLNTEFCPVCGNPLIKDGHDIPFETFLGFNGDKIPDIDLNFSGDYQSTAHEYVRTLLGSDNTFRAGTIQTIAEKNAYGYASGYFEDSGLSVRKTQIEQISKKIMGVKRSTGQHPGGIVIVPKGHTIYEITPVQYPADDVESDWKTTHFDYHSFEDNLLKLDILGHDDPTMIKFLMDHVKKNPDDFPFAVAKDIPLDDKEVYKLFRDTSAIGLTFTDINTNIASAGVPEFGTSFTKQMLEDIKPTSFAQLVKVSGLSHGTDVWLKNAQFLVQGNTEFGKIPFDASIGCRDDIMTQLLEYQLEPLMAFEIMEFVRKGKPSVDKRKWFEYEAIMRSHNVPEWYIWSAAKIKYMFPKAHATAYVIMAIRIAWFKVYRPLLFYSGFFSKRCDQFDYETMVLNSVAIKNKITKLNELINSNQSSSAKNESLLVTLGVALEMTKRGYKFLPVNIEKSDANIFIMEENGLRMPFITVDGLGMAVALDIISARNSKPFVSKSDVKKRTKINKTTFERMDNYGAFIDLKDEEESDFNQGIFAL